MSVRVCPLHPDSNAVELLVTVEGQEAVVQVPLTAITNGAEVLGFFMESCGKVLRPTAKRIKKASVKQERRIEELGGNRQSGSGARPGYKGDGRVPGRFRVENKLTMKNSFRVELADLMKIRSECEGLEIPIFEVQFLEAGTMRVKDEWVMLPRKEWIKYALSGDD